MRSLTLKMAASGDFVLQNPAFPPGPMIPGHCAATYRINAIPDDVTAAAVLIRANGTTFLGCYECDYAELGTGRIVRGRD